MYAFFGHAIFFMINFFLKYMYVINFFIRIVLFPIKNLISKFAGNHKLLRRILLPSLQRCPTFAFSVVTFLTAFPFSLFKTVLGEGVQTVGSVGPGTS